jgi:hypothetical protein
MLNNLSINNLEQAKCNFSDLLNQALQNKYHKKVSVVFFVNQFNLRAHGTASIAYETGRKWLNGIAIPQLSKMKVLVEWLNLDIQLLFSKSSAPETNTLDLSSLNEVTSIDEINSQNILNLIHAIALELDPKHQNFLFITALTLKEFSEKNDTSFDFQSFLEALIFKIKTLN